MNDEPATTYIVSVFEQPHWRTVPTTKDKQKGARYGQGDRRQGAGRGDHAEADPLGLDYAAMRISLP